MKQDLCKLIAYDANRKYFGDWTPKALHAAYAHLTHDLFPASSIPLHTGVISVDDICDALWNEMSYNPERFGTKNPFEFQYKNSIDSFCTKYAHCNPEVLKEVIFTRIATELKEFVRLINIKDPNFSVNGKTYFESLDIRLQSYYQKPEIEYVLLSILVRCIREITNTNQKDYKEKIKAAAKTGAENKIDQVILQRHPSMERPVKIENYAQKERKERADIAMRTLDGLDAAIRAKNYEIEETQTRIRDYGEYDGPVDTTSEENLLSRQEEELQDLESKYSSVQKKINALMRKSNEYQKGN